MDRAHYNLLMADIRGPEPHDPSHISAIRVRSLILAFFTNQFYTLTRVAATADGSGRGAVGLTAEIGRKAEMDRPAEGIKMMELSKGEIYLEIKIDIDAFLGWMINLRTCYSQQKRKKFMKGKISQPCLHC